MRLEWLIQLLWIIPVVLILAASCYGNVTYPGDSQKPGRCYKIEDRPGVAAWAGRASHEIPCP